MTRYTPTNWQNQIKDTDGTTVQKGTPLSAENMNNIENAITNLSEESHSHANKELLDSVTAANVHEHKNKAVLDSIVAQNVHEHKNKEYLDLIGAAHVHTHSNKPVLEKLTQKHIDDSHTHTNKAVLDNVTQKDLDDIKAHSVTLTDHEKRLVNLVESITSLKIKVVQTITERNSLTDKGDKIIHVVDATGDPTVKSGWAQYIYQNTAWVKIAENESIDVVLAWANITGKPSTFVPSAHTHIKTEVGLGNVDNVQQASKTEFNTHNNDVVRHITSAERAEWNTKADGTHTHSWSEITGKPTAFTPTSHGHTIAQVDGLTTELDKKFDKTGGLISGLITLQDTTIAAETITFNGSLAAGMRVSNAYGYVNIAPLNSGWAHIYTDRTKFIFNKPVYSAVNAFSSYDANLYLQRAAVTKLVLGSVDAIFTDVVKAPSFVQLDGKVIETVEGATNKVNSHATDKVVHITSAERIAWNGALTTLGEHQNKLTELSKHTHDYNALTNKPTIPGKTSQLTNDSGFTQSNAARMTVSTTAPTNPQTNDIWIVI